MGPFGALKALASDCRALPHEKSMAPAAPGILVPTPAEQTRAMHSSDWWAIAQVWDPMATFWFAVRPCVAARMDLAVVIELPHGVSLPAAAM